MSSIYTKWRICALHLTAKALGVLVHLEGRPYGSNRIYLRSPEGRSGVNGGVIGTTVPASASELPRQC